MNKDEYLVLVKTKLKSKTPEEKVIEIINCLLEKNSIGNYKGYIPENTEVLSLSIKNNNLDLSLSNDIVTISSNYLSGLIHSLLNLNYFDNVTINTDTNDKRFNRTYDKTIPINVEYKNINRKDNDQVVVYYLEDNLYYVPVTRYSDMKKNKIEVIIEELKTKTPSNLKSYLDDSTNISYDIGNDYIALNFINDKQYQDLEIDELGYSVLANYDVSTLIIKVNDKLEKILTNPIK